MIANTYNNIGCFNNNRKMESQNNNIWRYNNNGNDPFNNNKQIFNSIDFFNDDEPNENLNKRQMSFHQQNNNSNNPYPTFSITILIWTIKIIEISFIKNKKYST